METLISKEETKKVSVRREPGATFGGINDKQ